VPTTESPQCLICVADAQNAAFSDISNAVLAMLECRKQMPADLNGDCYVDFRDFAILMDDWLNCDNPFDPLCN